MIQKRLLLLLAGIGLAAGCSVYRPDVQQGNVLEPAAVDQLRLGLTKKQVRFIMGDPILIDPFHPDRWDYLYTLVHQRQELTRKRMTIYFQHGVVSRFDPSERPVIESPLPSPAAAPAATSSPAAAPASAPPAAPPPP